MRDLAKHPWITAGVRMARSLVLRVDEEARAGYAKDEESCGLLVGPAAEPLLVDELVPFVNRAAKLHALDPVTYPRTARMYFDLDPLKFQRAIDQGESSGRPVKVLYHSHLDAGAYFSETDAAAATMGGPEPTYDLAYLVTSVAGGVVAARALFVWSVSSATFVEAPLTILDEA
jgi:[CysO sulfur-carrier protein]-S-L-cysteine hydrolase